MRADLENLTEEKARESRCQEGHILIGKRKSKKANR